MKAAITIELNEDQRIAVGLLETGKLVPCTPKELRSYALGLGMASIETATKIVVDRREEAIRQLNEELGAKRG